MFWNILLCWLQLLCSEMITFLTSWETLTITKEPNCWVVNKGIDLSIDPRCKTTSDQRVSVHTEHHKKMPSATVNHESFLCKYPWLFMDLFQKLQWLSEGILLSYSLLFPRKRPWGPYCITQHCPAKQHCIFLCFLHRIRQLGKYSPIKHSDITTVLWLFLFIWKTLSVEYLLF